ncbi:MAG TPA: hypothetical protein VLG44_00500 [Chlamydiales bacterium]|nr:hypothetical protein [Chlamydiales bacterium]
MSAISNCFKCIPSNQFCNSIGKALTTLQKKCADLFAKIRSDNSKNALTRVSQAMELEGGSLQAKSPGVLVDEMLSTTLTNGGYRILIDNNKQ